MKPRISSAFIVLTAIAASFMFSESAGAQCDHYIGQAVGGQSIVVDSCSISRASYRSLNFIYYLGGERVDSQANCEDMTWTTFPERQLHRPRSRATMRMLDYVCNYNSSPSNATSSAFVFAPPSNVRVVPNGDVLCVVRTPMAINTYGAVGQWYYTDVCGSMGVIHDSQLRF